jgi:hypothetical protein
MRESSTEEHDDMKLVSLNVYLRTTNKASLARSTGLSPSVITKMSQDKDRVFQVEVDQEGVGRRIKVRQPQWRYIEPQVQKPGNRTRNY